MATSDLDRPCVGRIADGAHRLPVRVYYEDTDAGGVVYHANYLRYFERARTELLRLAGADLGAALAVGTGGYVVAEVTLRYLAPARLGDALVIESRVGEIRSSMSLIHQRVMRDAQVVADGQVRVVFVSPEGRPTRQPAAWVEGLRALMEG